MGGRVVFVDYVQEIDVPSAHDARERIMKAVSALKLEAIRLGITLVLGSQLRKPPAGQKFYEPKPEDLKEASELHRAAEVLILCWREATSAPTGTGAAEGEGWKAVALVFPSTRDCRPAAARRTRLAAMTPQLARAVPPASTPRAPTPCQKHMRLPPPRSA